MIQIYNKNNDNFEFNGDAILDAYSCKINTDTWQLDLEHPKDEKEKWKLIKEDAVLKVPSFQTEDQLFRIFKVNIHDFGVECTAQPIFYDCSKEVMLEDVRPTNKTGQQALDIIFANTSYSGKSDIMKINTAYYVLKNPMEAILGDDDNSFVNRWGGNVIFNNKQIVINQNDDIVKHKLVYGKNIPLDGMNVEIDDNEVVTRIYPKAFNGRMITNKFVDSPIKNKYVPQVRQKVVEFENIKLKADVESEEQQDSNIIVCENQQELDRVLTEKCNEMFASGLDKPKINIKCDMVLLERSVQYENFKFIRKVNLFDTIECENENLGISTKARVIKLVYDCINDYVESVEIGTEEFNFIKDNLEKINGINNNINSAINGVNSSINNLDKVIDSVVDVNGNLIAEKIQGTINALKTKLEYQKNVAEKQDVRAILFEDTDTNSPTFGALSIGTLGIQISNERNVQGDDWVWGTAIDSKSIYADLITAGTLRAIDVEGVNIRGSKIEGNNILGNNITGGTITGTTVNGGVINGTTINTDKDLNVGNNINLGSQKVDGTSKKIKFTDTCYIDRWYRLNEETIYMTSKDRIQVDVTNQKESARLTCYTSGNKPLSSLNVSYNGIDTSINVAHKSVYFQSYPTNDIVVTIEGNLVVTGKKNRCVKTSKGKVLMNAIESPEAYFEDLGHGVINNNGLCKVELDSLFLETVETKDNYYIHLTSYSKYNVYVFEKKENYFVVGGVRGTEFDWRVTFTQKGYSNNRMEVFDIDNNY